MRFLLDENADARLVLYLQTLGHDVTSIMRDHKRSLPDLDLLAIARSEQRVLITNDRDFGELLFRHRHPHAGVVYFRLSSVDFESLTERLSYVLTHHGGQLDQFIVVTDHRVRIRPSPRS